MNPDDQKLRQAYAAARRDLAGLEQDEAFVRAEYDKACAMQLLGKAAEADVADAENRLAELAVVASRKRAAVRHLWESVGSGDQPPVATT